MASTALPCSQMRANHDSAGTFAQRFCLHDRQCGDQRWAGSSSFEQCVRRAFQGREPRQSISLPVGHEPFFIPVRQKFDPINQQLDLGQRFAVGRVDESLRQVVQLGKIHRDFGIQAESVTADLDEVAVYLPQPPKAVLRRFDALRSLQSGHKVPASLTRATGRFANAR